MLSFNSEKAETASVQSRPQNLSLHDSTVFDSNKAAHEGDSLSMPMVKAAR